MKMTTKRFIRCKQKTRLRTSLQNST